MSTDAKPGHEQLLYEAAQRIAPLTNKLVKLLGDDGALLLLAAAGESLIPKLGKAGVAELFRRLAVQYEDGRHFDAGMN